MIINLTNPNGTKLPMKDKLCKEDITIIPDLPGSGGGTCTEPHVIEVEVLPEVGAVDYNAVYLCGGRYYKYVAGGGTYKFNDTIDESGSFENYDSPDSIPAEEFQSGAKVKISSMTIEGETFSVDGNVFFYPVHINSDSFVVYMYGDFGEGMDYGVIYMHITGASGGFIFDDITFEILDYGKYKTWFEANTTLISGGGGWKEWIPKEECGGGAELNIAYGDTPPEDTTKLWCKCSEPSGVQLLPYTNEVIGVSRLSSTLPYSMCEVGSATVGTDIYLFGGMNNAEYDTIIKFDTLTDTRTLLGVKLPAKTCRISAEAAGTIVYLFSCATTTNKIYKFDTQNPSITELSEVLPVAYRQITSAAVGTKIYLFGGYDSSVRYNTIYEFDTKTEKATELGTKLPHYMSDMASAVIGTKVYLLGGIGGDYSGASSVSRWICIFNAETKEISESDVESPLYLPPSSDTYQVVYDFSAVAVGTKIYLLAGGVSNAGIRNTYEFDTKTNTMAELTSKLPSSIYQSTAEAVGTKVYVFGGKISSGSYSNAIVKFIHDTPTEKNKLSIVIDTSDDTVELMPDVTFGFYGAYKGDEDNIGTQVEAYLYKDGSWKGDKIYVDDMG